MWLILELEIWKLNLEIFIVFLGYLMVDRVSLGVECFLVVGKGFNIFVFLLNCFCFDYVVLGYVYKY